MNILYIVHRLETLSETFVRNERHAVEKAGAHTCVAEIAGGRRFRLSFPKLRTLRLAARLESRRFRSLAASSVATSVYRSLMRTGVSFDVVHAHFATNPALVAILVADLAGARVTFTTHANDYRVGVRATDLRARIIHASHVFAISSFGREDLIARARLTSVEGDSITVVRAQTDAFDRPARRLQPGADSFRMVSVARLVKKKGIDEALEVLRRLRLAGLDAQYDIVGDGPEIDRLKELALSLGVSAHVTWHGAKKHEEAMEIMSAANMAILPCKPDGEDLDGIPVFLMEAVANSLPVVTTAISGIPELIPNPVEPSDLDAMVSRALSIANNPESALADAEQIRLHATAEFAGSLQAKRLISAWARR